MKEVIITIGLEPTVWQRILDALRIKRFMYDECVIVVRGGNYLYRGLSNKIKVLKVQEESIG